MQVTSYTYHTNKLQTWILSVTLLLGLSVFSGYAGKTTVRYRQPVQTTWNYTNNDKSAPGAVSYKKATTTLCVTNNIK